MSLEEFIPDIESGEDWWTSAEASTEVSEKFKDSVKKASKKRKKTQKDEKKAKKYDFMLANFLVQLILKKKYDDLLSYLFSCLDKWYWTNFLLWILSLVYLPISDEIRKNTQKEYIIFNYKISDGRIEFSDEKIDSELKNRINSWIEDIESVLFIESSSIITEKIKKLLKDDESIKIFTWKVFKFFFNEINIEVPEEKSNSYGSFIIWELTKSLKNKENLEKQ